MKKISKVLISRFMIVSFIILFFFGIRVVKEQREKMIYKENFLVQEMNNGESESKRIGFKKIKEQLDIIGVPDNYSNNIINYIENIKFTEEELNKLISDSNAVYEDFQEINNGSNIDIETLVNIYNGVTEVVADLNIDMNIDIINRSIKLIDKDKEDILFECDEEAAKEYYNNIKTAELNKDDYYDVFSYIADIERNSASNEVDGESYVSTEIADKNSNKSEKHTTNTKLHKDSKKDNNEIIRNNKEVAQEKIRRVEGSIFIVLLGCILLSSIIGIIATIK